MILLFKPARSLKPKPATHIAANIKASVRASYEHGTPPECLAIIYDLPLPAVLKILKPQK